MKKIIFSLLAVCISCVAFSQNFMQGVGINVILQSTAGFKADPVGSIIYSPRVSFMEDGKFFLIGWYSHEFWCFRILQ